MRATIGPDAIDRAIDELRRREASRDEVVRAVKTLDDEIGEIQYDLSTLLRETGPRVVDGREYSHAERDGLDVVEVRPAEGES